MTFIKNPKFWLIVFFLIIFLSFFSRPLYRVLKSNKDNLPTPLRNFIEKRDARVAPSPIVYKEEQTIKVIEGWTLRDIANHLETVNNWSQTDFFALTGEPLQDYSNKEKVDWPKDFSESFDFLKDKPAHYGLEGFLFPDTYRIFKDASAEEVIITMLKNFDRKLNAEMRAEIARQGKTIYEIIILASIIEKEAPINYADPENKDARLVAGIFYNRLKIGQALQSDATLSYLYNDKKSVHSSEELEIDSPYNSYKYPGLPPTPICNPGLKAIEAAIYPLGTNYNYFLTSLDGKNIYYARTYEEHLNNKYKYLK